MPDTIKAKAPTVRMRLTEAEARLIRARRGAGDDGRRQVVIGYREPRDAEDAIAVFSAFAEANWGNVSTPAWGGAEFSMETPEGPITVRAGHSSAFLDTLKDDELEALHRYRSVSRQATAEPEFRANLSMARCLADAEDGRPRYEDVDVEARIVPRSTWEGMKGDDGDGRWAAVTIEDGRILALRLAPPAGRPWHPWGAEETGDGASRAVLLQLRGLFLQLVTGFADARCVELIAGRNGASRFDFSIGDSQVTVDVKDRHWD